ncbi:hypothetical protein ACF0H5_016622 [Mactra antiquata]
MGDVINDMDNFNDVTEESPRDPDADKDNANQCKDKENKEATLSKSFKDEGKTDLDKLEHPFSCPNETSDLRLLVEGKPLYVSRVVLSLVSPILKSLLSMKGNDDNVEMPLSGKKYSHMVEFLSCIYPDILAPITEENAEVVLDLADNFQVSRLVDRCEDFLVFDISKTSPPPHPEKIVRYLSLAAKYELPKLQKATFEAAAKMPSDLLENIQAFWDLPAVTTTSLFIRRLKLFEKSGKTIRCKQKEIQNHCSLYHKGEKNEGNLCTKCYAQIGKHAINELQFI